MTEAEAAAQQVGSSRHCPVCNLDVEEFVTGPRGRPLVACPHCMSLERDRFLALLLDLVGGFLGRISSALAIEPSEPAQSLLASLRPVEAHVVTRTSVDQVGAETTLDVLPAQTGSVDLVLCSHVLHTVPDEAAVLAEIRRVLSPHGVALIDGPLEVVPGTERIPPNGDSSQFVPGSAFPASGTRSSRPHGGDGVQRFDRGELTWTRFTPRTLVGTAACESMNLVPDEPIWVVRPAVGELRATAPSIRGVLAAAMDRMVTPARHEPGRDGPVDVPPVVEIPNAPRMTQNTLLAAVHAALKPRTYLEIGVQGGQSLALASGRAIGVDPEFRIDAPLAADVQLLKMTSDQYFASKEPTRFFDGLPADLIFIDGMHLAEYAYRDFASSERLSGPATVVVLDDVLPRTYLEAARLRSTRAWAGDVFKALDVIEATRSDLIVIRLDTEPTGTAVVVRLDPDSNALAAQFEAMKPHLTSPDPQQVPVSLLIRSNALPPEDFLASGLLELLRDVREGSADADDAWRLARQLRDRSHRS